MSLTECLKRENEPKSTRLAGKLFQIFITRSAQKVGSNRAITEVLENLVWVSFVELDLHSTKSSLSTRTSPESIL